MNIDKNIRLHKDNAKQPLKVIKTKDDEFYFGLYLLKVCYKTILDILEAFCGGFFNIPDSNLNSCYLQCLKQVGIILNSQKKIKDTIGKPPKLFESLVGDIEEADQKWQLGYRQAAREYYGKIENLFVEYGSKSYELPKFIQDFFDYTKRAIDNHIKTEATWRNVFGMTPMKKNVIKYGDITIDADKSTLQYKENKPTNISLNTKEIVFLSVLLKENGNPVRYRELTKLMNIKLNYEAPGRICQYVKRNLRKYLLRAGMTNKEISKTIVAVRNIGFRIIPQ